MGDLQEGFYLVNGQNIGRDPDILVLGKFDDRAGMVILRDEHGRVYAKGRIVPTKQEPLSVEEVEAYIQFDRGRVKFVDDGLAELAKSRR